jgi:hypothetical protein
MVDIIDILGFLSMQAIEQQLGHPISVPRQFYCERIYWCSECDFGHRHPSFATTSNMEIAAVTVQEARPESSVPDGRIVSTFGHQNEESLIGVSATVISIVRIPLLEGANTGAELDLTCTSIVKKVPTRGKG